MDIEQALRSFILLDDAITALIGKRFYWDRIEPEMAVPFVRATTITDNPSYNHNGSDTAMTLVQLDIMAESKSEVNSIRDTLFSRLSGYHGSLGDYRDVIIFTKNVPSNFDEPTRLFRRIMELEVGYV